MMTDLLKCFDAIWLWEALLFAAAGTLLTIGFHLPVTREEKLGRLAFYCIGIAVGLWIGMISGKRVWGRP
jgi:hypothetical protein